MNKPIVTVCGVNIRQAATRLALLDMTAAAMQAIAAMPLDALEPVEGRRGLVIDSISAAWSETPEIRRVGGKPLPQKRWPSSSRQRFGGKR